MVERRYPMRRRGSDENHEDRRTANDEPATTLKRAEDVVGNYRDRETTIGETSLAAQDAANELRVPAELDTGKADAEELWRRVEQDRADLASEIEWLRTMRTDMRESIRSLLLNTLHQLDDQSPANSEHERSLTDVPDSRTLRTDRPSAQADGE
jgi:hypothetical protein